MDHHIQTVRAGLAALEGRRDDAVALYRSALTGFRSFGARFSVAMAVFDMATFLGPDEHAVASVVEEGRGILEELNAKPLLELLAKATARATASSDAASLKSGVAVSP